MWIARIGLLLVAAALAPAAADPQPAPPPQAWPSGFHERSVEEGVVIEVGVEPLAGTGWVEGEPVAVRIGITQAPTGDAFTGLYPAAWIDRLPEHGGPQDQSAASCRQRIEGLIGGSPLRAPVLDLNRYLAVTLDEDATLQVVDPLFGLGGSKLLATIRLASVGEDWEQTGDGTRLFVSMPDAGRIAVIETAGWSVEREIEVGGRPRRLRLQPDERYLWTTSEATAEGPSGVSVIDARRLSEVARIETGRGPHEMVLSDDGRLVFVSNQADGTVSVIDAGTLTEVHEVPTGEGPTSLAYSPLANAVYVTHPTSGSVAVIDAASLEVTARIPTEPGTDSVRFAPGGRYGFAVNPPKNLLQILDAAVHRVVQAGPVEASPYEVDFSAELAYVLHRGSETVLMVPLDEVGGEGEPLPVVDFPGGESPPGATSQPALAEALVPAPAGAAVLLANPGDGVVYVYKEGMAAPMGHFVTPGKSPRAVTVVDRSLRESAPGVYGNSSPWPVWHWEFGCCRVGAERRRGWKSWQTSSSRSEVAVGW